VLCVCVRVGGWESEGEEEPVVERKTVFEWGRGWGLTGGKTRK